MKHFRKFMEDIDSTEKPVENRVDAAKKKFETQKMKTKSEIESTKEKIKDSGKRSTPMFNKHKSVNLNKRLVFLIW